MSGFRRRYADTRPLEGQRRGRRRDAERQPPVPIFRPEWHSTTHWATPDGRLRIREMEDGHLWHTINWIVRQAVHLYKQTSDAENRNTKLSPALLAYRWLREQPAFRAMVKDAARRDFTFPQDVFTYLKQYVLENGTIDNYQPWHDPLEEDQAATAARLRTLPAIPPEREFGRCTRTFD